MQNQEEKFRDWVRANIQRHDEMIVGVLNLLKELRDISLEQNGKQAKKGNGKSPHN